MRMLVCAFVVGKPPKTGFLVSRPKCGLCRTWKSIWGCLTCDILFCDFRLATSDLSLATNDWTLPHTSIASLPCIHCCVYLVNRYNDSAILVRHMKTVMTQNRRLIWVSTGYLHLHELLHVSTCIHSTPILSNGLTKLTRNGNSLG